MGADAVIMQGKHKVSTIWIHCSATRPEWMSDRALNEKVAEIRRWHTQDRGWRDIGYHWIVDRDGKIAQGRPETQIGAHVAGHNAGSIGICLIGGHGASAHDNFSDHFTAAQDTALRGLILDIQQRAQIQRIRGHNEVAAKGCPGFQVSEWLAGGARSPSRPANEWPETTLGFLRWIWGR